MSSIARPYVFEPDDIVVSDHLKVLTGDKAIDGLNFKRLIAKAMSPESGYGWTESEAVEISELYRAFLFLCKLYPQEVIVPPREVDEFWHLHILDTRNYALDCEAVFGSYLHHFPYSGLEGTAVDEHEEIQFIERTQALLQKHFPFLLER